MNNISATRDHARGTVSCRMGSLEIFSLKLEVALGMIANGADFGSILAYHDVTTIEALPNSIAFAAEY